MIDESSLQEVRPAQVKFNKVGDYIYGTLIEAFQPMMPDKWGKKNKKYRIIAEEGQFYGNDENKVIDTTPTIIEKDSMWTVFGNDSLDQLMSGIRLGQFTLIKLTELKKTDKGNPAKIRKVLGGKMNEGWLAENEGFSS